MKQRRQQELASSLKSIVICFVFCWLFPISFFTYIEREKERFLLDIFLASKCKNTFRLQLYSRVVRLALEITIFDLHSDIFFSPSFSSCCLNVEHAHDFNVSLPIPKNTIISKRTEARAIVKQHKNCNVIEILLVIHFSLIEHSNAEVWDFRGLYSLGSEEDTSRFCVIFFN